MSNLIVLLFVAFVLFALHRAGGEWQRRPFGVQAGAVVRARRRWVAIRVQVVGWV